MKKIGSVLVAVSLIFAPQVKASTSSFCAGMYAGLFVTGMSSIFIKNNTTRFALVAPFAFAALPCLVSKAEAAEVVKDPSKALASNLRFKDLVDVIGFVDATSIYQMISDGKPEEQISKTIQEILKNGPLA